MSLGLLSKGSERKAIPTYGEEMRNYLYFIYKIDSHPNAEGEYLGPFATERERDEEAKRLRGNFRSRGRTHSVYRANVEKTLAAELGSPSIVAA